MKRVEDKRRSGVKKGSGGEIQDAEEGNWEGRTRNVGEIRGRKEVGRGKDDEGGKERAKRRSRKMRRKGKEKKRRSAKKE